MTARRLLLPLFFLISCIAAGAQVSRQTTVSTRAGSGTAGYNVSQDGAAATAAQLNTPQGVVTDVIGNIYIADTANNRVRKIDGRTGIITTIAGNGTAGYRTADENVVATFGELNAPQDLALDGLGNLYIADTGNHRVRKVVLSTNIMTTAAGNGATTYNQQELGNPYDMAISKPTGIAVDPFNNLYIVDAALNRVFYAGLNIANNGVQQGKIRTYAGNGTAAYTNAAGEENVTATIAHLSAPQSIAVDRYQVVYIADSGNGRIRKVDTSNKITTIAGDGTAYSAATEGALATAAGIGAVTSIRTDIVKNLYLSLGSGNRILKLSVVTGKLSTYAGTGTTDFIDRTIPTAAAFNAPAGIAVDAAGTLYIADSGNHRLRSIPVATGNLLFPRTAVGSSDTSLSFIISADSATTFTSATVITPSGNTPEFTLGTPTCSTGSSIATGATCSIPVTFTPLKPGRRMAPIEIVTAAGTQRFGLSGVGGGPLVIYSPNVSTPFAGSTTGSYTAGEDNGPAIAGHFLTLSYLEVDAADNILIADARGSRIRSISPSGIVTTLAGNGLQAWVAADEGALATNVGLAFPSDAVADAAGNIYIGDASNGRIRKIDAVTKRITTYAGNGNTSGNGSDGILATAGPVGGTFPLFIDQQGDLYFTDNRFGTRRIDAATGYVNAVVSNIANLTGALNCGSCQGRPVVDDFGTLYMAGTALYRVNQMVGTIGVVGAATSPATAVYAASVSPNGDLLFYLGNSNVTQYSVTAEAFSTVATYPSPSTGFVLDSTGNAVFQTVAGYQLVRTASQTAKLAFTPTTVVGATSTDSPKTLTLFNIGNAPFTLQVPNNGLNPSVTSDFQLTSSSTCPQLSTVSSPNGLNPATGCKYGVNFIPVAPGPVVGQALFTDNQFGSATPVTQSVSLTGTASGTAVTTSLGMTGLGNTIAGTAQTITVTAYSGVDQTHIATNYTGTVTFTTNDTNTGVIPAAYTFTSADAGVHTFTVTLKLANDRARVAVTDNSNAALTASTTVNVTPAKAVTITALSGTPQSVATNAIFTTSLTAVVKDTYGNPVPGVSVTFAFPSTGASATVTSTTQTTDGLGQAHVLPTANATTGGYNVSATAVGVSSSAFFQITNTAPVYAFTILANVTSLPYGPDVRLSAHISPNSSNGHDPSGTVTIYEGATVLATGPVPAGHADFTFLVPAPSVGVHTYSASYTGDSVYPAATQANTTIVVTVAKGESSIQIPFTTTIQRPGSFAVTVENLNGADSSTKAYIRPSGVVTYTITAACGSGAVLTGSLTLVNGATTFPIPADCAARTYGIDYAYAGDSIYNATTIPRHTDLTVTAPVATISITNLDQNYDGTPKPVTVTTTPAGLAYSVSYSGSNGVPTLAGIYSVTVTITDPNYTASATATLTVHAGPTQIFWPNLNSIVYGTPLSTTQLSATTTIPGVFSYNPVAGTILTPGNYVLSVTFTPNDSPNTPTTATQALTVTKAGLTIKAVDAGRIYGAANPVFTANVTGAVNGDTFTTSGTTTATTTSPVGTYPIAPSVTGANLAYYTVTSVNGTLTVSGAPATVTLSNLNQVSDGSPKPATVTTTPAGLATTVTYNGSTTAPSTPGSYSVVATITDANYTGTANGVLVITASAATVTWNSPAAIAYGTALSATQLNATASAAGAFVYTPAAGTVLSPGTQTLNVVFTPTAGGPTTSANVTLVVNKGTLTVTAANASRLFGAANPPLTATITGAVNGDILTATATTSATTASAIGTYPIIPSVTGTNVAAYNVTLINGTLSVLSGTPTVTLTSNKPSTFVGDTVTFTATLSGAGATPTGTVEFFNGSTSLGVKTLAAGVATVSTSTLTAGVYNITAVYSGDTAYSTATSAIVVQTIFTSDYSIVVNPTVLTIIRGGSGTATFTVTPIGNFHDTITFACNSLPTYATCTFAPPTLTPNGGPVSTTLTIKTSAATTAHLDTTAPWQRTGSGVALATMIGLLFTFRRRRSLPKLLLLLLLSLSALTAITGCGGSPTTTPVGSYPITVSAGVSTGGSGSHSVNLTVNIVN